MKREPFWLAVAAGLLLIACSGDDAAVGPGLNSQCVQGAVVECLCVGGDRGIRVCQAVGGYGRCECGPSEVDVPATPNAGSSGGRDDGGAQDPDADMPDDPEDPDADMPDDPEDPDGKDPDDPDDPENGENTDDPQVPPAAGELFGPCTDSDACDGSMQCTGNQAQAFGGSDVGYCAPFCSSGKDGSNFGDCPRPKSGHVDVLCSPFSFLCELGNCSDAECPAGMRCQALIVQTPLGAQVIHTCAFPPRRRP